MQTCRAVMRCDKHGCEYTARVVSLLGSSSPFCPECNAEGRKNRKSSVTDEDHVRRFRATGAFAVGTTFSRSQKQTLSGNTPYWDVQCPVCSEDEFSIAGLCDGTFVSHFSTLTRGGASCRCSDRPNFTNAQWLFRVQKDLENRADGSSLVRVEGSGAWVTRTIHLHCDEHKSYQVSVQNFLYGGGACPSCATNGFDPSKPAHLYILRAYSDNLEFTGYGIAGDVDARLKMHRRNLKRDGFLISEIETFALQGDNALTLERRIKGKFPLFGQATEGFRREATYAWLFDDVVAFAEDQCFILEPDCML